MTEDMTVGGNFDEVGENGRDNKIWIIVAVVLVVLCCCCVIVAGGAWWLWNNGDQLFGLAAQMASNFL